MTRRGRTVTGLVMPMGSPTRARARGLAWRAMVYALRPKTLAYTLLATSIVVQVAVLVILYLAMHTLQRATCVIGGESLMQCLKP